MLASMSDLQIELAGQPLLLLPEKAAFLPGTATLLVADVHLGKAHSFRRLGVPVPSGTTAGTLDRLGSALARTQARALVILGDLLHGPQVRDAAALDALAAWRTAHAQVEMTLVRGNHDDRAGDPPPRAGIRCVDEGDAAARIGPFVLQHHPQPAPEAYALAGHTHPCVVLRGRWDGLRLPCFWFGAQVGVLPAFGEFTGMHAMRPGAGDRVYAVGDGRVMALPPLA